MLSMLLDAESSIKSFFIQVTKTLGFTGLLILTLAVELFFVLLFVLRTVYSYEVRLGRSLDKLNSWLFINKKLDTNNIREFNDLVKKSPKRLVYNWQQYILFREKEPTYYISAENIIEKPLKTSSWTNNIRNLLFSTVLWSILTLFLGIAYSANGGSAQLSATGFAIAILLAVFVLFIGILTAILLRGKKTSNLDELYNNYHIFARFLTNACVDLPPYIDFDLLFTRKEIAKGNPQLREYYESRARKAKEEFENAKKADINYEDYDFSKAGVNGSLVLDRAMRETENFINKKTSTLAKIAHVEAEREALRRNYENVQKDLQRKIQAAKENINKLIQQQEATTNRMEVGFLRKQQEQEIAKQEALQTEYDQEETRFSLSSEELNQEETKLRESLDQAKDNVQKAMVAEYQSFYERVMKSALAQAERKVAGEKSEIIKQRDENEKELIVVQTQIKRLIDENNTLRTRLGDETTETADGQYDENGNFIYADGSYHDAHGLFHDTDGKIYDMNGTLIEEPKTAEELEREQRAQDLEAFGDFEDFDGAVIEDYDPFADEEEEEKPAVEPVPVASEPKQEEPEPEVEAPVETEVKPAKEQAKSKRGRPRKEVTTPVVKEPKKRGRPRKETDDKPVAKKPVGRPKKAAAPAKSKEETKKDLDIEKINKMISDEESKLSKMKMLVSSELDEAMSVSDEKVSDDQMAGLIKDVEELQKQAIAMKDTASSEQLAKVNERLETLIKEISNLNK